jgi:hypothetical protein
LILWGRGQGVACVECKAESKPAPKAKAPKVSVEDAWKRLESLACALSPENLYCDGEISNAEAERKRVRIMREWARMERVIGYGVSVDEVENRIFARFRG